jgi:hypothetical protein
LTEDLDPESTFLLIQSFLLGINRISKEDAYDGINVTGLIDMNQQNQMKRMTWNNYGLEFLENMNK